MALRSLLHLVLVLFSMWTATAQTLPNPVWADDVVRTGPSFSPQMDANTVVNTGLTTSAIHGISYTFAGWFLRPVGSPSSGDQTAFGSPVTSVLPPRGSWLHLVVRSGNIYFGTFDNDCATSVAWPMGSWNHVAWVYNVSSQRGFVYLNGYEVASCPMAAFNGAGAVGITAGSSGGYFPRFWYGQMQFLRIFNVALSPTQVQQLVQSVLALTNQATWTNDVLYAAAPFTQPSVPSIGMLAGTHLGITTSSFTMAGWFLRKASSSDQVAFGSAGAAVVNQQTLFLGAQNGSFFFGTGGNDCLTTVPWPTDSWNHVAFVFNLSSGTQGIFLNMQLVALCSEKLPYTANDGIMAAVRASNYGFWSGAMQKLRIFNAALSGPQLQAVAGAAPATTQVCSLSATCSSPLTLIGAAGSTFGNSSSCCQCVKAADFCHHNASVLQMADCDGDGKLDAFCQDTAGHSGYRSSVQNCGSTGAAQWPTGVCFNQVSNVMGLYVEVFNSWRTNYNVSTLVLVGTGVDAFINFPDNSSLPAFPTTSFSMRWTGFLSIEVAGNYTFRVSCDDTCQLSIDSKVVVLGAHDSNKFGSLNLTSGFHSLQLAMNQASGGYRAIMKYSGPDTNNQFVHGPSRLQRVLVCSNFTCPVNFQLKPNSSRIQAFKQAACCDALLQNPDFEQGFAASPPAACSDNVVGEHVYQPVQGWISSGLTVALNSSATAFGAVAAASGSYYIGLQNLRTEWYANCPTTPAQIIQSVPGHVVSGVPYLLRFWAASRSNEGCPECSPANLTVAVDNQTMFSMILPIGAFVQYSVTYTPSSPTATIAFTNMSPLPGDYTAFLDNVAILQQPTGSLPSSTTSVTVTATTSVTTSSTTSLTTSSTSSSTTSVTATVTTSVTTSSTTSLTTSSTSSLTTSVTVTVTSSATTSSTTSLTTSSTSSSTTSVTVTVTTSGTTSSTTSLTTSSTSSSTTSITVTTASSTSSSTTSVTMASATTAQTTTLAASSSTSSLSTSSTMTATDSTSSSTSLTVTVTTSTTSSTSATVTVTSSTSSSTSLTMTAARSSATAMGTNSTTETTSTTSRTVSSRVTTTGTLTVWWKETTGATAIPPPTTSVPLSPEAQRVQKVAQNLTAIQPKTKEAVQNLLAGAAAVIPSAPLNSTNSSGAAPEPLPLAVTLQIATAVEGAASSFMQSFMNQSADGKVNETKVVTFSAGGISMTLAALPLWSNGQDISAPAAVPTGVPLAQPLPQSALQAAAKALPALQGSSSQIGLKSCSWPASFNPYGPAKDPNTGQAVQPSGQVISLSLTDQRGQAVPLHDLSFPILLAIPVSALDQDKLERDFIDGRFPACRWFNETTKSWDGDGCKTLGLWSSGTELLCSCTHLTTFTAFDSPVAVLGGILNDFLEFLDFSLIACARVGALFSGEGFAALQQGTWVSASSAAVFFILACAVGFALALAIPLDFYNTKDLREVWSNMEHVHWFDLQVVCRDLAQYLTSPSQWSLYFVRSVLERHVSMHLRISQGTLTILEEARREAPRFLPKPQEVDGRSRFSLAATLIKASCHLELYKDSVKDSFTCRDLPSRESLGAVSWAWHLLRRELALVFRTFAAVHPLLFPILADPYTLISQRVLILATQLLGSIFCSALYYHQTSALTPGSSPECETTTLQQRLQKAVPVAIVSGLVTSGPAHILYNIISERPRPEGQCFGRVKDRIMSVIFYIAGLALCCFFLIYIAAFLANISGPSADLWMLSALWVLLSTWVMMPMAEALFAVFLTFVVTWKSPNILDQLLPAADPLENDGEKEKSRRGGATETKVIQVRSPAQESIISVAAAEAEMPGGAPPRSSEFMAVMPAGADRWSRQTGAGPLHGSQLLPGAVPSQGDDGFLKLAACMQP